MRLYFPNLHKPYAEYAEAFIKNRLANLSQDGQRSSSLKQNLEGQIAFGLRIKSGHRFLHELYQTFRTLLGILTERTLKYVFRQS